jgi:hypothetical protein
MEFVRPRSCVCHVSPFDQRIWKLVSREIEDVDVGDGDWVLPLSQLNSLKKVIFSMHAMKSSLNKQNYT